MDRKAVVVIVLCFVFLFFWFKQGANNIEKNIIAEKEKTETKKVEKLKEDNQEKIINSKKIDISKEEIRQIKTNSAIWTFSTIRGLLTVELLDYRKNLNSDKNVIIGNKKEAWLALTSNNLIRSFIEEVKDKNNNTIGLSFESLLNNSVKIKESWILKDNQGYIIDYKVKVINISNQTINTGKLAINGGYLDQEASNDSWLSGAGFDQVVNIFYDSDIEVFNFNSYHSDLLESNKLFDILDKDEYKNIKWISIANQFFTTIVEPIDIPIDSIGLTYKHIENDLVSGTIFLKSFSLDSKETKNFSFTCYVGPKKLNILSKLGEDKKRINHLGYFFFSDIRILGLFTEFILKVLNFFNDIITKVSFLNLLGSYGVAIIFLTLTIKIIIWPVNNKANKSMKKMQLLSPKLKELKQKYKNDPQEFARRQWKLFKEEGVNPMGGCLPILIQMPIFLALFNAIRNAIELRQSNFLWISDLTQPDTIFNFIIPIRPFAIMWIVLMILQQSMTTKSLDPMQRKMMFFMPLIFAFFTYGMPSGLMIYWTFQTLLSILQFHLFSKKL